MFGNIFRNNTVKKCNIRSQCNGYQNEFYNNLFFETKESTATNITDRSQAILLQPFIVDSVNYDAEDLKIYNNTIIGTYNEAIIFDWISPTGNQGPRSWPSPPLSAMSVMHGNE